MQVELTKTINKNYGLYKGKQGMVLNPKLADSFGIGENTVS